MNCDVGAGLLSLASCPSLTTLQVRGTRLDDAGLAALARVGTLRSIDTKGTRVTPAGVAAARAANPELRIYTR
jgi:hypothetical protein